MRICLVNTNRIKPPIAPIGIEYVAEALYAARHEIKILDLCWEDDWRRAIAGIWGDGEFAFVELGSLMCGAGCAGINFGVDSGDEDMLKRLKRNFTRRDIANAALLCRGAGIPVMFDLLLGSPGETRESIIRTIELMRRVEPDRVGVSVGVRVYPGTELAESVKKDELVGDDRRFFFFDPSRPDRNYNYNANRMLVEAINKGCRGAYWDILRRCWEP